MSTSSFMSTSATQRLAALGREFESLGHLLWAEWVFKQVARRGPPSSTAYYLLGRIQAKRGKLSEGKKNFARGLELKPDFYQCRVSFFHLCRDEHWQPGMDERRSSRHRSLEVDDRTRSGVAELHRAVGAAITPQVWYEIGRFDSDDMESCVLDNLEAMRQRMKGRAARAFGRQLDESRRILDQVVRAMGHRGDPVGTRSPNRAMVALRDGSRVVVDDLRDGDDLIGSHLEIIEGGRTQFVPLGSLKRVRFGRFGEFTEVRLEDIRAASRQAVVPAFYYGSRFATMPELKRGEVSMFKELYRGIQIGVGRRVFHGINPEDGSDMAVGMHEIGAIEFMS